MHISMFQYIIIETNKILNTYYKSIFKHDFKSESYNNMD